MIKLPSSLPKPAFGIIGHRGAAGQAPENTLAGFSQAHKMGLTWVEFDVQPCKTGEWVVIHDDTLERTTNGVGKVHDTPYEIIKTLDAGSFFNTCYHNERIPSLPETLSCLMVLNMHPNIEIKGVERQKKEQMINFLAILDKAWPKTLPPPLISCFDLEILLILKSLRATLELGFLIENDMENALLTVQKEGFTSLHCDHEHLTPDNITKANQQGIPLLTYTVNEPTEIKRLLAAGVTAVFSDLTSPFVIPANAGIPEIMPKA